MVDVLESDLGATDVRVTEGTLCGLPAETIRYQMPVMGNIAPHPAIAVAAILSTDDMTYVASVGAQATDADNPTYQRDVDTMLTGFQLLPPSQT
jgi:hypothetical protein